MESRSAQGAEGCLRAPVLMARGVRGVLGSSEGTGFLRCGEEVVEVEEAAAKRREKELAPVAADLERERLALGVCRGVAKDSLSEW